VLVALIPITGSVTNALVNFATNVVTDLGLPGVFLLMALDATGIPIPSEVTMLFAGFDVYRGHNTLLGVIAAGVAGDLFGGSIAYAIGYYGRLELLGRHGAKLHITPERLALADRWFERFGTPAVFFSRMVPVVRAFISFPAGAARMPYPRFLLFSLLGVLPWVTGLAVLGRELGSKYQSLQSKLHYVDLAVAALIVVGVIYLVIRRRRAGQRRAAHDGAL
jgi:membrane protein DedA with SNARE-associated domain